MSKITSTTRSAQPISLVKYFIGDSDTSELPGSLESLDFCTKLVWQVKEDEIYKRIQGFAYEEEEITGLGMILLEEEGDIE